MFDFGNLLQDNLAFGGRSWVAMALWVAGLIGGIYLYQGWREANPLRARFVHRSGLTLAILCGVGLLVLVLRAFGVPLLSKPIWGYLLFFVTLGYIGWSLYYYMTQLPALVAASRDPRRSGGAARGGAKTYGTGGHGARTYSSKNGGGTSNEAVPPAQPRPVATTTRREARRDKKRKSR